MQRLDLKGGEFDFDDYIGVEFLSATKDRVAGRLVARQQHLTNGERIHGGLLVAMAEALAGHGSGLNLEPGCETTTIELKTNFMQRGEPGPIFGVAVPLHVGRSTMVWQTTIQDEQERRLAVVQQTQIVFRSEQRESPETDPESADSSPGGDRGAPRSTPEKRRAQIAEAAFPLIADKGFAQTSVREIAEAAGMSVPAIYKYVSNKDEILELIYQDYISQAENNVAEAARAGTTATEKLHLALEASKAEMARNHAQMRLMYRETRALQPEVRDRVKKQGLGYFQIFQDILEEGIASGEFRAMDAKLVGTLIPQLCEVWTLRPWAVGPIGIEKVYEGITDLVFNGIGTGERNEK